MSIASLHRSMSGLLSSKKGLEVTGHNITNVNTTGYTRQQILHHDNSYLTVGVNGGFPMQVGTGVQDTEIRQIRNSFLDQQFRSQNSFLSYYQTQTTVMTEIETILDEPFGEALSGLLTDFLGQTQKLSSNPENIEERMAFIQSANNLMERARQIQDSYTEYQFNLDDQVRTSVKNINEITDDILEINKQIVAVERTGQNANDYRDVRNNLLDELSSYMQIDVVEEADGSVIIHAEGNVLVNGLYKNEILLEQSAPMSPFKIPVFKDGGNVFNLTKEVNSTNANDGASLKALLIARGNAVADAETDWKSISLNDTKSVSEDGNSYIIPELQKNLDMLMMEIANIVNGAFDGEGIGVHEGLQGVPVFVPIKENERMTTSNMQINPELLETGGYNKLGTVSVTGEVGDNTKVQELLAAWNEPKEWYKNKDGSKDINAPVDVTLSIPDFFTQYVRDVGQKGATASSRLNEKISVISSVTNEKFSLTAVSLDEELATMMRYQYAYNASARMVTMLDGMIETVLNQV
ncbi:MAG: flagellar hook-associated protein FlgK [Candidatus Epulonipiscium fishelsonii]|nr:MAG: flagellar hook-associated protein FlgK [Epulopiscium sp. AS2M-Bin002]